MGNSHGVADMAYELQTTTGDLLPACVVSTTPPVPVSGLTLAAFATRAYVRAGQQLTYVDQPAVTVTLTGGDGAYWLAITDDTFSAFSGWTRRAGSHYMWRANATRPSDLDNLLVFSQLTVAGGNITAVSTPWGVAPPLALATADKVSIGGHAATGVLDVQGSVVASDKPNQYFAARLWPVAPSGSVATAGLLLSPATGAAISTAPIYGIICEDQPVSSGDVMGILSVISAGAKRYNISASGTAQNYFAGNVGIANAAPSYPLDVTGTARVVGSTILDGRPSGGNVTIYQQRGTNHGLVCIQSADSGAGNMIDFRNAASTGVGSVTMTATATAFNTSSDVRLKHGVQALGNALSAIQALRPVSFKWKADDSEGHGFLANEVQSVIPEAVTGNVDAVDEAGQVVPQQMDHSKLVPWLVAGMQELAQQVQALTARLVALEGA